MTFYSFLLFFLYDIFKLALLEMIVFAGFSYHFLWYYLSVLFLSFFLIFGDMM